MKNKKISSLKNNLQIKDLFKKGRTLKNTSFLLKYKKNDKNCLQFAISVNKKIFRTAVLRNKIKRQIRHIIREFDEYKSIDLLIIVLNNYLENKFEINKKNLIKIYKNINNVK